MNYIRIDLQQSKELVIACVTESTCRVTYVTHCVTSEVAPDSPLRKSQEIYMYI